MTISLGPDAIREIAVAAVRRKLDAGEIGQDQLDAFVRDLDADLAAAADDARRKAARLADRMQSEAGGWANPPEIPT